MAYAFPNFTNLDNFFSQVIYYKNSVHKCFRYYKDDQLNATQSKKDIVIDSKKLFPKAKFINFGSLEFSDQNKYFAFAIDVIGSENYKIYYGETKDWNIIKKLNYKNLSDNYFFINDTFYFVQMDNTFRPFRVLDWNGNIIFTETDPEMNIYIYPDIEAKGLIIYTSNNETGKFYHYSENKNIFICGGFRGFVDYSWDLDMWYISIDNLGFSEIPNSKDFKFNMTIWNKYCVFKGIVYDFISKGRDTIILSSDPSNGSTKLYKYRNLKLSLINHNENLIGKYELPGGFNQERRRKEVAYIYHCDLKTPNEIIEYDMISDKIVRVLKDPTIKQKIVGNLYLSKIDNIPITKWCLAGNKNALLIVYGAYGFVNSQCYREWYLSLIKKGWDIIVGHIRGGGELGNKWYQSGKLLSKKNTFIDTIKIGEKLKELGYKKVCIFGRSAGGLTVGASLNMANEGVFDGAILEVPFLDVFNTMNNPNLPLTTGEYSEWGNPQIEKYGKYIKSYDPIINIDKDKEYPKILVIGGKKDNRVKNYEPKLYYKKMKKVNKDITFIQNNYGHFGSSNNEEKIKDDNKKVDFIVSL